MVFFNEEVEQTPSPISDKRETPNPVPKTPLAFEDTPSPSVYQISQNEDPTTTPTVTFSLQEPATTYPPETTKEAADSPAPDEQVEVAIPSPTKASRKGRAPQPPQHSPTVAHAPEPPKCLVLESTNSPIVERPQGIGLGTPHGSALVQPLSVKKEDFAVESPIGLLK